MHYIYYLSLLLIYDAKIAILNPTSARKPDFLRNLESSHIPPNNYQHTTEVRVADRIHPIEDTIYAIRGRHSVYKYLAISSFM